MRFKDLAIGTQFDFDHSSLHTHECGGMAHGPWIKLTPRKYAPLDMSVEHEVGSINVSVRTDGTCGNRRA